MQASGHARWLERLLAGLQFELWIGNAAKIQGQTSTPTDKNIAQPLCFPRSYPRCPTLTAAGISASFSNKPCPCFRGERRSNETHASRTDPESLLARKGEGKESKLSYTGNLLARPASNPSASDRCPLQTDLECGAHPAPAAFADTDHPPC
jgi:hypothetical protein